MCPEHEHWQQRTLLNPISTSRNFADPDPSQVDQSEVENTPQAKKAKDEVEDDGDDLEVMPPAPVLTVRDQNREHTHKQRGIAG